MGNVGNGAPLSFNGVNNTAAGSKLLSIDYINGDTTARRITLRVNGQQATVL